MQKYLVYLKGLVGFKNEPDVLFRVKVQEFVLEEMLRVARGRRQSNLEEDDGSDNDDDTKSEDISDVSQIDDSNNPGEQSEDDENVNDDEEVDDDDNGTEYDSVGNVIVKDSDDKSENVKGMDDKDDEGNNDNDDECDDSDGKDDDDVVEDDDGDADDNDNEDNEGIFVFKKTDTTPVHFRHYNENEIAKEVEDARKALTTDGSNENTLCAGDIISYFHPVLNTWIPGNVILSISEEHDTIGVSGGVGIILKDTQIRLQHAKYNKKSSKYVQVSTKQNLRAVETYDVDPSMNGKIPVENGRADTMNWILKQMDEAWKKPLPECAEAVEGLLNMLKEHHPGLKDLGEEKTE
jgi:hypothetical protein